MGMVVPLREVVYLHSIRSADWDRIMANWVLVVDIHGGDMRLWHWGGNLGMRNGVAVISHVQHWQLLMLGMVVDMLMRLW